MGWSEPYIYALLIVSIIHLGVFVFWEAKIASSPILPFNIWKSPSFGLILVLIFFSFMGMGIFLWYTTLFALNVRGYSIIETGGMFQPLSILGTLAAFLSAWLIPRLAAQYIIALGTLALVVCNLLLATTPPHQTYWAMMFPAIVLSSFTVDFSKLPAYHLYLPL